MKFFKRLCAILLVAVLLCTLLPQTVLFASAATYSGTCGGNLTWTLDTDTGELVISGTGAMGDFNRAPWYSYRSSIKRITIGNSVTSIGRNAFWNCTRPTGITIPDSVTSIGNYAFERCTGLTGITIPDSVTSIGNFAFYNCTGLTSISVSDGNTHYDSRNDCNAIIETATNTLIFGCKNTRIPDSVTSIGGWAFWGCTGLTSITIPDSVTSIGRSAFCDCTGLTGITIPDSVKSIGNYAFSSCTRLTGITIPDSVTSIGNYTFDRCTGLTSITIPNSVKSIGDYAFRGCTGLTSITIPSSVTSIGDWAFDCCTGLTGITIPDSVTSIGGWAFWGCDGLTSITIPDSVTSIGGGAFRNCTGLTSISVSDGNPSYDSRNGCNAIIETATKTLLTGCKNTKIPSSVTGIGDGAFEGCTGLTSITIPDSVTSIGGGAFRNCTGLTSVYYTGSKEQWDQISIGSFNSALTGATIYYNSAASDNRLTLLSITPNHTVVGPDARFVLTFNKNVEFGSGIIEVREETNGIAGQYIVADYVKSMSINGNKVTIDISGWLLKDGAYSATISKKAFKTPDGTYYCGLTDKTAWTFEVCSNYDADGVMEYAQTGVLWWKHDDTTKPAIPNGTDSQYAQILLQWAKKNGISNLTEQDVLRILDEPMYLPATDMNGATVLLDDKQMTVRQTLEDILFFESLQPFAEEIDDDLSDVVKFNQIEKANVNPIRMETDLYEKVLGWYPQVDKYLNRRNECNPFYSSAAPFAYQGFLTAFEAAGGEVYSYTKPLLKATLDTSIAQSSYAGLSQYAQYSDFKNAASEVGFLIKTLKTEGEAAYLAKTSTDMSGSKMIVRFGVDLLRETFKYSENNTLTEISTAWDDYDSSMSAGELCAFLGSSIGAFPMVIDLYNNLDSREAHMAAAFYFVSDYYVQEKYPEVYNAVFDDTGFPAEDFDVYWFQASTGITGENDPILYNWLSYLKTISEGVHRNRCRQLRYDLVNYIMLLQHAQEFDASAAKVALLKYISAECSRDETTQLYASCPVTVEVYDKTTDQLIASLSSEDEEIQSCEYGSLYLLGENNETKCFVLNSDAYYARIIPYDDGTMDVTVAVTDENGETAGKVFQNVSLTNGVGFELNLDNLESGLEAESGETIEKDSYISVNHIDIVGENGIAAGATMQLKANVYPVIATNRSLTWSSSDAAVATVDENGVVTGIGEGTAVITATSADEVTAEKTVTVFIPATELSVDTESLSMVEGESYQLSATVSDNATHDVQWGTNNMNAVTVSPDGELTARAPGSAIVTATIDGISSEVFVTVYENQLDVEMYQLDMGRNALRLVISNRSCVDDVQESAYVASYESGRQIAIESISIDLPANGSLTTEIELPDFTENTTYSTVFYPLGERAAIMQPQELVFVNGGYDTSETTEAASGELPSCKKETITCKNVTPGEEYTVYVLTDDSGIPTQNNIEYISRKTAETEQMSFVVCAAESSYRAICYIYLSDSAGSFEQIGTMIPHNCSYTTVEPTCTKSGIETYTCAVCGESETRELAALGHDYMETVIAPSCVDQGYSLYTCSRCAESYKDTYTDPLGHNFEQGICSRCGVADPAYENASLIVSGGPITALYGETVTVPVMITGGAGFAGFTMTITTTDGITLKDIEKGELLNNADGSLTKNLAQGKVNWTDTVETAGNGEILLLTIEVSETAGTEETITIRLKDNKSTNMVDSNGKAITTRFEDIVISAQTLLYGDTNSDGEIDAVDAVRLVRYIVDLADLTELQKRAADVNHDGDITSADAIRLVRYLVGLVDTLDSLPTKRARCAIQAGEIKVASVDGQAGDTVLVPVLISDNPGFAGFTMELSYPDCLQLVSVTKGNVLQSSDSGALTVNLRKNIVNWNDITDLADDGELLILTFKISNDVTDGQYTISIAPKDNKVGNFATEDGCSIAAAYTSGGVQVGLIKPFVPCVNSGHCPGISFADMPAVGNWAHDAIDWAITTGVTVGTSGTTFSPDKVCTRAEVVTFLWREAGSPEPTTNSCGFTDVKDGSYYEKAVIWAAEKGIAKGTSESTFSPDKACTRAEVVTFLWRANGSPEVNNTCKFTDVEPGTYYERAVIWAAQEGITVGTAATIFGVGGACTRAQIVTFLYRNQEMQ